MGTTLSSSQPLSIIPLSNQLYITEMLLSRLYTNDTGRLPI
jgi:hypothetical protein